MSLNFNFQQLNKINSWLIIYYATWINKINWTLFWCKIFNHKQQFITKESIKLITYLNSCVHEPLELSTSFSFVTIQQRKDSHYVIVYPATDLKQFKNSFISTRIYFHSKINCWVFVPSFANYWNTHLVTLPMKI